MVQKAAALAALLIGVALPPVASGQTAGAIVNAQSNATWTAGTVESLRVGMADCGSDGQPTCDWSAIAGVLPAAFSCPRDWAVPENGFQTFWGSGIQTANGTVDSGPRIFGANGAPGQRVCLYLSRRFTGTGAFASILLAQALAPQAPPPEPSAPSAPAAPPAVPVMPPAAPPPVNTPPPATAPRAVTVASAAKAARSALARRFKTTWTRGTRRRVTCSRLAPGTIECRVSWRRHRRSFSGRVIVTGPDAAPRTRVSVRSRRLRA